MLFEDFLYGDGIETSIDDWDFLSDRIIMLPKIRPHSLSKAVSLSLVYCQKPEFRGKLLCRSLECPVLMFLLYKEGVFSFLDFERFIERGDSLIFCYYFRKDIEDFNSFVDSKSRPYDFDESFVQNEHDLDLSIEHGFVPSSIEYCLKYDDVENLRDFDVVNVREAKWSPFEWSYKPGFLDLLSFTGFFGSINCFKHLLINGYHIREEVISSVVCSGSLDLFHICQKEKWINSENMSKSIIFCHQSFLEFFLENGLELNRKHSSMEPIHYSSKYGHLKIVDYLISRGANVNARDEYDQTPLHFASENGHLSVVEYLLDHGADIDAQDESHDNQYIYGQHFIVHLIKVI